MSLIARSAGVAVLAGLTGLAAMALIVPIETPAAPVTASGSVPFSHVGLPSTDRTAGPSLLERSPFSRDRGVFSRDAGPRAREIEVRLAGVFRIGKEIKASLIIDGQSIVVGKGDVTPAGAIADIEPSAIVLDGPSPRRIDLFQK